MFGNLRLNLKLSRLILFDIKSFLSQTFELQTLKLIKLIISANELQIKSNHFFVSFTSLQVRSTLEST